MTSGSTDGGEMVKISLCDEVLTEIGKITVIFGLIDHSLAEIIGRIVTVGGRPNELGQIVTAELSFKQRIATVDSLLLFALGKDHDFVNQFAQVKPLLFKAEEQRNLVVHSIWLNPCNAVDSETIIRLKTTAKQKRGLHTDFVAMTLPALRQITDIVAIAFKELCFIELHFHEQPEGVKPQADREEHDKET